MGFKSKTGLKASIWHGINGSGRFYYIKWILDKFLSVISGYFLFGYVK